MLNEIAKANVNAALEFMATKSGLTIGEVLEATFIRREAQAVAMFQDLIATGLAATPAILAGAQ